MKLRFGIESSGPDSCHSLFRIPVCCCVAFRGATTAAALQTTLHVTCTEPVCQAGKHLAEESFWVTARP